MNALINDLRFSIRYLRLNAAFTATTLGVIALGVALSASLFAVVKGALLDPWPYEGYERIVTVRADVPDHGRTAFSLWSSQEVEALRNETDLFDSVIAGFARNVNLVFQGRPERVRAARITPNAFSMLATPATQGRVLVEADAENGASPVVVISHQFWTSRMAAQPVIGRTLRIGEESFEIVGVMPERFRFWDRQIWLPLALDRSTPRDRRDLYVQARLKPGITHRQAESRMTIVAARWRDEFPNIAEYRSLAVRLTPLVEAVLRDLKPLLHLLLYAVCGVLVAAACNVANAMLAKSLSREGELATRRALGATATQMARQMVIESVLISVGGGAVGVALAAFLLPQILSRIPYGFIPAESIVSLDASVVITAVVVAVLCGLTSAAVPALRAATIDPVVLLQAAGSRSTSGRPHRLREVLIGMQLSVAVIVLGFALTTLTSNYRALSRDPGFDPSSVWTARIALPAATPADRARLYRRITTQLSQTRELEGAGIASSFPVTEMARTLAATTPLSSVSTQPIDADIASATPEFFELLRLQLVDGRFFNDFDHETGESVAIISNSLAERLWPQGGAIGSRLFVGNHSTSPITIVGIAGDIINDVANAQVRPAIFRPLSQQPSGEAMIGVRGLEDPLTHLTAAIAAVDPEIPIFDAKFLDDARAEAIGPQLLATLLFALFGATVIILSGIGLYAIMTQSMLERTRELTIRLTFGAQPVQLFAGEMLRSARVIVLSAGVGGLFAQIAISLSGISLASYGWLPTLYAAAAVAIVALGSTALPAYRASRPSGFAMRR